MSPISKLISTVGVKAILARKHRGIILFIWVDKDGCCAEVEEKVTHRLVIKSERFYVTAIGGFFTILLADLSYVVHLFPSWFWTAF
jgi:hypothetical protein